MVGEDPVVVAAVARTTPVAAVLQTAIDVIRIAIVERDGVILPDVHVVEHDEVRAAVVGHRRALVVADIEPLAVVGIDPHRVEVALDAVEVPRKSPSAIFGHTGRHNHVIQAIGLIGIELHVAVVKRPVVVGVDVGPGRPRVFRAVDARAGHLEIAASRRFNDGGEDARVLAVNRQANLADVACGQTVGQLRPGVTAVGGLVDAAVGATALEDVGTTETLPETRVEDVRVARVHHDVAGPGAVISRQTAGEFAPRLATVDRLEDAALRVVIPEVSLRRDVDDVGVGGVGDHLADVVRLGQSHVDEGLAAVGGFVDAVAPRHAVAHAVFTGAHPDDLGVGLEDGDVPDRGDRIIFKDRRERRARVC